MKTFDSLTTNQDLVSLYNQIILDPDMINTIGMVLIQQLLSVVSYKRNINHDVAVFRQLCQDRLRDINRDQAHSYSINKTADRIFKRLQKLFITVDFSQAMINDIAFSDTHYTEVNEYYVFQCRLIGSALFDFTSVATGLWTVDALINKINNNDTSLNTNEHYQSLHANYSRVILDEALAHGRQFTLRDLAEMVFEGVRTIRSTKNENHRLAVFHRANRMITPQHSYDAVDVSQLIYIPSSNNQYLAWVRLFEIHFPDIDVTCKQLPFSNIITYDQAVIKFPQLRD